MTPATGARARPPSTRPRRPSIEAMFASVLVLLVALSALGSIVERRAERLARDAETRPVGLPPPPEGPRPRFDDEPEIRVRLGRFAQPVSIDTRRLFAVVIEDPALPEDFALPDPAPIDEPDASETPVAEAGEASAGATPTLPADTANDTPAPILVEDEAVVDVINALRADVIDGAVVLRADDLAPLRFPLGASVRLIPDPDRPLLSVTQRRIDRPVVIRPRSVASSGPRYDVIAEIPLERYLPGVLTGELYAHWSPDTFRAQAVVARSYALHERARARERGRFYDIDASTVNQAYAGESDLARARDAVDATRGLILETREGELLRAYYASTCGGRAASAADIWRSTGALAFNAAEPLQPLPPDAGGWAPDTCGCASATYHRWKLERRVGDFTRRFDAWAEYAAHPLAKALGPEARLAAIEATDRNPMGRPNRYRVTDTKGRGFDMRADEVRIAANFPVDGLRTPSLRNRVKSNDLVFTFDNDTVTIEGRGFGHGVGLCQFGAEGLSRRGWTWPQMLERFYPNARLARAFDDRPIPERTPLPTPEPEPTPTPVSMP